MPLHDGVPFIACAMQFFLREFSTSRVARVIVPSIGVTVEAQRNGIIEIVTTAFGLWQDVMNLNLDALVPVAHATVPCGGNQCSCPDFS
jgi:hypothetical protein